MSPTTRKKGEQTSASRHQAIWCLHHIDMYVHTYLWYLVKKCLQVGLLRRNLWVGHLPCSMWNKPHTYMHCDMYVYIEHARCVQGILGVTLSWLYCDNSYTASSARDDTCVPSACTRCGRRERTDLIFRWFWSSSKQQVSSSISTTAVGGPVQWIWSEYTC